MTIETVGPGGVGNNYGTRSNTQPSGIGATLDKTVYNEFGPYQGVTFNGTSLVSGDGVLLVLSAAGLAAPLIVGHDNQTYTRNSANAAGDNTFANLASFTLPAGCMGPNGTMIFEWEVQTVGAVQSVGIRLAIGGVAISPEVSWTAATYDNRTLYWFNTAAAVNKFRGTTVRQGNNATGFTGTTIDTAVSNTVDIQCRWGAAASAHSISLHAYRALVEFGG